MIAKERMVLVLYWGVVGLLGLVFAWWIYYFSIQGDIVVERVRAAGFELPAETAGAVHTAIHRSQRMFLYEGGFLGLLLLVGVLLALRAMRREVELQEQQRDLVSAVTHELRSPIASARLYIESLQLGRVPEAKRERYLANAKLDLERLNAMVDRLLESARMAHGLPELRPQRLDLAEYVSKSVERIAYRETGGRLAVEVQAPDPVLVEADASALETILRNLIVNSAKYGGEAARMLVRVAADEENATLEVRDFGPGLTDIDAKGALKAFTRGGDEAVRSRPGVGLGLYLVEQLTRALGGRLRAGNVDEGSGFLVCISLPLAAPLAAGAAGEVEA